jgi:uncharacterized membrane protein YphA (DoxX/SURF4 family)
MLFFLLPSIDIYSFIGSLPSDFFVPPPGPMMLFEGFPSHWLFLILHGLLILSLCLMILGWRTKFASLATGIIFLIINGFIYSAGKINHDMLIIVVPMLMAFSGWGKAYCLDSYLRNEKERVHDWTLTLLALIIGFMFFTAGFSKIIGGWLDVDSQATLGHFFKQYFVYGRHDLLSGYALDISNLWVWEFFDYTTVLFEAGFLLAIFFPRSTRIYVCLAVLFHFSTMLVLNITFLPNFLAYAAFLNWDWINEIIKKQASNFINYKKIRYLLPPVLVAAVSGILLMLSGLFAGVDLLKSDWGITGVLVVSCSVPIAVYYLFRQLKRI